MLQKLVNHNPDIKRLVEKGCAIAIDSNYLIVRDIPYLDYELKLKIGAIATKLDFIDENKVKQTDHQVYFSGSIPYGLNSNPIPNLASERSASLTLSLACQDVVIERIFSNKPIVNGIKVDYSDFFDKIESYISIISGPAMHLYDVTPYTFRIVEEMNEDSIFKLPNTLTSRAEIGDLSEIFKNEVIAIIGLGGTGSYVLDFISKTHVKEIKLFDPDNYVVHNVYRSPGKFQIDELGKNKASVFYSRYENFRAGITAKAKYIDLTSREDFKEVTFAFVCIDCGVARSEIFDLLILMKIPFIDVGMGIKRQDVFLKGLIRTNYYPIVEGEKIREKRLAPEEDNLDNIYKTNIQIAELNALNACLAVIRYKQLRGFYLERVPNYMLVFDIADMKIVGESLDEI